MPQADWSLASGSDPVGESWGTHDALTPVRVRNLTPGGMLVESPIPLDVESVHEFELIEGASTARVRAAVRHLSSLYHPGAARCFLMRLEFLNLGTRSSAEIERMIGAPFGNLSLTGHCNEPSLSSRLKLTPLKAGVISAISSMMSEADV